MRFQPLLRVHSARAQFVSSCLDCPGPCRLPSYAKRHVAIEAAPKWLMLQHAEPDQRLSDAEPHQVQSVGIVRQLEGGRHGRIIRAHELQRQRNGGAWAADGDVHPVAFQHDLQLNTRLAGSLSDGHARSL